MENLDLLQNLMLGEGGFLIKLRFGDGIELDQVEKIKELLKQLACEWRRKVYVIINKPEPIHKLEFYYNLRIIKSKLIKKLL